MPSDERNLGEKMWGSSSADDDELTRELLGNPDGQVWAESFCKLFYLNGVLAQRGDGRVVASNGNFADDDLRELMHVWFANAIETGRMAEQAIPPLERLSELATRAEAMGLTALAQGVREAAALVDAPRAAGEPRERQPGDAGWSKAVAPPEPGSRPVGLPPVDGGTTPDPDPGGEPPVKLSRRAAKAVRAAIHGDHFEVADLDEATTMIDAVLEA